MAKQSKELLFLKSTGVLIGEITSELDKSKLDLTQFDTKIIEIDTDAGEYWYGDFATGQVRSMTEKVLVVESNMRYNANVTVLDRYPIHTQLNIIIDMLAQTDLPKTEKFVELKEYLDLIRAEYQAKVTEFSSKPDTYTWISLDEEKEIQNKKLNLE
jgi:hypothetical protein